MRHDPSNFRRHLQVHRPGIPAEVAAQDVSTLVTAKILFLGPCSWRALPCMEATHGTWTFSPRRWWRRALGALRQKVRNNHKKKWEALPTRFPNPP